MPTKFRLTHFSKEPKKNEEEKKLNHKFHVYWQYKTEIKSNNKYVCIRYAPKIECRFFELNV